MVIFHHQPAFIKNKMQTVLWSSGRRATFSKEKHTLLKLIMWAAVKAYLTRLNAACSILSLTYIYKNIENICIKLCSQPHPSLQQRKKRS